MNLRPPPVTDDIDELRQWCVDLHDYLKDPHFKITKIQFIPISSVNDTTEGTVYYDSDDDKLLVRDSDSWETVAFE